MKFKMAPNSLFAVLLRNPWWISYAIVGVFVLASSALLPKEYVAVGIMGSFPFLVIGTMSAWRQWRAPDPKQVAQALKMAGEMSWREFSLALEKGFQRQGFTVGRIANGPADFRLEKAGQVTLVSCKRWKAANLGVESLRELVATRDTLGADRCTVISLRPLTDTGAKFAKSNQVAVMGELELSQVISGK
jgi:restriction system protein